MAAEARDHGPGRSLSDDGAIRQHQTLARSGGIPGQGGAAAVSDYPGRSKIDHPDKGMKHRALDDDSRANRPNMHMGSQTMAATRHSSHGPHGHDQAMHGRR